MQQTAAAPITQRLAQAGMEQAAAQAVAQVIVQAMAQAVTQAQNAPSILDADRNSLKADLIRLQETSKVRHQALTNALTEARDHADKRTDDLEVRLNKRMDKLEVRIGNLEVRISNLEVRMGNLEERMDKLEIRMDKLEVRIGKLEQRMERVEVRLDAIEKRLDKVDETLVAMHADIIQLKSLHKPLVWVVRILAASAISGLLAALTYIAQTLL